jgi:hypothetical protein
MNLNYGKVYNSFAEHPLAPTYFKYIEILVSKDLNKDIQHLLDIAHAPMTNEISDEIAEIMAAIYLIIAENTDYTNEFLELGELIDNAH